MEPEPRAITLRRALFGPFTTLSLGAAAIHFAATPPHFEQFWAFGLFMAGVGWFQALWPMAYVLRPGARVALLGAVVNAATADIWAWSRLAGLPFGPTPGQPEPAGLPDVMATLFELALFVGLVAVSVGPFARRSTERRVSARWSLVWTSAVAVVVTLATSVALTLGGGSM